MFAVIPAKAGIHVSGASRPSKALTRASLVPRLRGDDSKETNAPRHGSPARTRALSKKRQNAQHVTATTRRTNQALFT
jgi:hypothetical protein